jgi:hypothetical protein
MKTKTITKTLGVLALLASSASMAATINVVASNATPLVGQQFTMTLSGDLPNVFAATIELSFNGTAVKYISGTGLGAFTVYVKNDGSPGNNPTSFYIEKPAGSVSGAQQYAQLTFEALAVGAANINFFDDGGTNSGWPDFDTFEPVIAQYNNANVTVVGAQVPVPAAAWLFVSALGGLATLKRKKA